MPLFRSPEQCVLWSGFPFHSRTVGPEFCSIYEGSLYIGRGLSVFYWSFSRCGVADQNRVVYYGCLNIDSSPGEQFDFMMIPSSDYYRNFRRGGP